MQKLQNNIFNKDLKWKISAVAIAIATNLAVYNIHPPAKAGAATKSDIKEMFQHEKETLHMPHNYGMRSRYTVILGNE